MNRLLIELMPVSLANAGGLATLKHIRVSVQEKDGKEIRRILDIHGELKELHDWLKEHRVDLLQNRIPVSESKGSCIADVLCQFYNELNPDVDDPALMQSMYDYRVAHCLRFAFGGTDLSDIYLGTFNGVHEVSCWGKGEHWTYEIDLPRFLQDIERLCQENNSEGANEAGSE